MIVEYNNVLHITGNKEELERLKNNFKGKPAFMTSKGEIYSEVDDTKEGIEIKKNWFKNLDDVFTFNSLIPMPDDVILQHYYERIDWMMENWGVEEDIYDLSSEEETITLNEIGENEHEYRFYISDGYPFPEKLIRKLSEQYPVLDFWIAYFHPHKNLSGIFNIVNGMVEKQEESKNKLECREIMYNFSDYEFDYICNECRAMIEVSDFDAFKNYDDDTSTAKCYNCNSENIRNIHTGENVDVREVRKIGSSPENNLPF